jgi:hypothetical protein
MNIKTMLTTITTILMTIKTIYDYSLGYDTV